MLANVTAKGIEAQLKAELRANELGYLVSKPITECCRYDMIIDMGNSLKRIQVKYCSGKSENRGSVLLNLRKMSLNGKRQLCYTSDEIDGLVVYIKPIDKICFFPIDVIEGKSSITIRYKPCKNNQKAKVYYCDDYIW